MSGGAVAIWHDIAPEGLDEFYAWHGEEHMPERVSIPGFLRGRRFVATRADLGFFNLYETQSPDVVRGPDYRARLDSPTPRTLAAVRHFRNVARSLCEVVARRSSAESNLAQGGLAATLRLDVAEADEPEYLRRLEEHVAPQLASMPGVASVLLLRADRAASGYVNAEQRARGAANLVPPLTVVAEGWGAAEEFEHRVAASLSAAAGLRGDAILGFYRLELTISRS